MYMLHGNGAFSEAVSMNLPADTLGLNVSAVQASLSDPVSDPRLKAAPQIPRISFPTARMVLKRQRVT